MGQLGQLLTPSIYDAVQSGTKDGQDVVRQKTLAQYAQPALGGDQGALAKIYGVDPSAGLQVQQNAGKLSDDAHKRLADFTHTVSALAQGGDLDSAKAYYRSNIGQVQSATGMNLGTELDPGMLPHIQQIASALNPTDKKDLIDAAPGHTYVDPNTMKAVFTAPDAAPKEPGSIAELRALKDNPDLFDIKARLAAAGRAPAAPNEFNQKLAMARSMGATPDQIKAMVMGQAASAGGDSASLSDGDERMAKALANYQLPAGARFISTKANRAIVQRALELNPQMSTSNYDQSHKFLQDLSSNSPTSAGGVITAAKTALSHLSDLSELSPKLPSSYGFVNQGENLLSSTFNGKSADTLKEWNVAKSKVAAEVLKMVKGGQINESESKEMLKDLDPNSPNRGAAIATLAKLMVDKSQAMEDKRDSILGDMSPHTSYLSASDQKKALKLIGLSKNLDLPQFAAPGGYGQAVPGSQAAPAPTAASPKPGDVEGGYRYKGGDPSSQSSWEKV